MDWKGKTAIVTGGASGIGRSICEELVAAGATVVVADINGEVAADVATRLIEAGGQASSATVDVTDATAVEDLVLETIRNHGQLDFMFNNAGVGIIGEVRDMSLDQWQRIVDVNLRGVLHGINAAYPRMVEQGHGHIVNMASVAGLVPMTSGAAYSMTKHAVVGLSTSLRSEAIDLGVKVSVVCPGFIDTPLKNVSLYLGINRDQLLANMPFKFYDPQYCARSLIRGVRRNKAIIVVTPFAKFAWLLFRFSPSLFIWSGRWVVRQIRKKHRADA